MSFLTIFCGILSVLAARAQTCTWPGISLTTFNEATISCMFTTIQGDSYKLEYTPCRNDLSCTCSENELEKFMVVQTKIAQDNNDQWYLAKWNETVSPTVYDDHEGYGYQFHYQNGLSSGACTSPNNRAIDIRYLCEEQNNGNNVRVNCGEEHTKCEYFMNIYIKDACNAKHESKKEDDGLSNGSIFLILLFVFTFIYCVGGYVYNGHESKDWYAFQNNIPHYYFWKAIPEFAFAGCGVTYEKMKDYLEDRHRNNSEDQLAEPLASQIENNAAAQFQPVPERI